MAIILKPLFEIFTGDIAICNNVLYNYIFLLAVGELAYYVSYGVVGNLYSSGAITGRSAGSLVHWIVRLPIYFFAAYILRALIWIYTFIISVPIQIWWVLYSTKDLTQTPLRSLSVYGSEDGVMNRESYKKNWANLPIDTSEIILDGGCHAQFGSYGPQGGDGTPTISGEEQIRQTVEAIATFAVP